MTPSGDLDELFEIADTDGYGLLRDRLIAQDDEMLENLVRLRKSKSGLTQDVVADRMGRSKTAVSNFERLGSDPHLSTVRRYAAAIGALITHDVVDYDIWRLADPAPLTFFCRYANPFRGAG